MDHQQELSAGIESYVIKLFERFQSEELLYHNLSHTQKVVERAKDISAHYSMDDTFSFALHAASWFHDCGHLFGDNNGHEERSNLIMRGYLEKNKISGHVIQLIENSIMATKFPYKPMSFLDEILCDADSYHLGTEEFLITDEKLKREVALRNHRSPGNWDQATLMLLETHHFFTDYCIMRLSTGKQKNIDRLRSKIEGEQKMH